MNGVVVGQKFDDIRATLFVGTEDGSHSTGLAMICDSQK